MSSERGLLNALLLMIIGRTVRGEDYGPSYPCGCPRCDNEVYFHLHKWRYWGQIVWIPLIPWFPHRELVCPICETTIEVSKKDFSMAMSLIEYSQSHMEGVLRTEKYLEMVETFEEKSDMFDLDGNDKARDFDSVPEGTVEYDVD